MATPEEYRSQIKQIVLAIPAQDPSTNAEIKHLAKLIRQSQKELRHIKKAIAVDTKEIRAMAKADAAKGSGVATVTRLFGARGAARHIDANERRDIARNRDASIEPYDQATRQIDDLLLQLDGIVLRLESRIEKPV